jgi:putative tryptophan/tyrosine transport system substrate-binding protein
MKRRDFIKVIGGGAAAWPLAAHAQPAKLPTIGFLGTATPSRWSQFVAAFVQRLRDLGWIEGRNVAIEFRWAEGRTERYTEIATEFVRLKVDVIVTAGGAVLATKQATSVIPIVFALALDPVGGGMVTSLARPGGNVTGLSLQSTDLSSKRIELLREVVPGLRRLAILANAAYPAAVVEIGEVEAAARTLGFEVAIPENSASRRHRARLRGAQGPNASGLRRSRPIDVHSSDSNQQLGARCATGGDFLCQGIRRVWSFDVVWTKLSRLVSKSG